MPRDKKQQLVTISIGIVFGILIWAFSPIITGEIEPWDAENTKYYYPTSLFLCGFIACIPYPKKYLMAALGIFLGQIVYGLFFRFGALFLIGVIMVALYSLIALLGSILGNRLLGKR